MSLLVRDMEFSLQAETSSEVAVGVRNSLSVGPHNPHV